MLSKPYSEPSLLQEIIKWEKEFSPQVPYLETPTGLFLGLKAKLRN